MNRIRPRTTVLSGAAIGLIAGAALYGAVSSSAEATSPTAFTVAKAPVASAPASAARCATGQKLKNGVCIIHVVRTVIVPAAGSALNPTSGPSESSSRATEPADHDGTSQAEHENAAEQAKDALEHTSEAAELAAANRD